MSKRAVVGQISTAGLAAAGAAARVATPPARTFCGHGGAGGAGGDSGDKFVSESRDGFGGASGTAGPG